MTPGSLKPPPPDSVGAPTAPQSRLARRRLVLAARIAWFIAAALAMIMAVVGEPANYQFHLALRQYDDAAAVRANLVRIGLGVHTYAAYMVGLSLLFTVACFVVGSIIGFRRSDRPMALFVSSLLILQGATLFNAVYALAWRVPVLQPVADTLSAMGFVTALVLLFVFPDGRFTPRWTRWLAALVVVCWFLPVPDSIWVVLMPSFVLAMLVVGGTAQIYRYRHISGTVERQQTRLVAVAVALGIFAWVSLFVFSSVFRTLAPGTLPYLVGATLATVCVLCIPAAFGIAILRYRLWDIDLIINRTLVYAPLTALLAGLFGGLLYLFEQLFLRYTGGHSVGAAMLAAVVVGAALTPLKNGIQTVVDRHVKVPPHPARTVPGAPGSDPALETLRGEIAALRAELAARSAADQELHQLREMIQRLERHASAGGSTNGAGDSSMIGPQS